MRPAGLPGPLSSGGPGEDTRCYAMTPLARVARRSPAAAQGPLRVGHGAVAVDEAGRDPDDAVTRLQDAADVDERGALGDVAALVGRGLRGAGVGGRGLGRLVLGARARALRGAPRRR